MRDSGTVLTVGTFDGVHRGHWRVLQALVEQAGRRAASSVLVTFEPHPLRIVRPDAAPSLLTSPAEKLEMLAQFGIDHLAVLRFDAALAAYPPRRFVEEILIRRFRLEHLVVGHDHGFGRDRSGDAATLAAIGAELGFGVHVVPPLEHGGDPISSTRIRRALQAGDVVAAAEWLGRPYTLRGTVVPGQGWGRGLGFPTANLQLDMPDKLLPLDGVYAARAFLGPRRCDALLHVGPRPTFDSPNRTVELHVLDFDGDLYGRTLLVQFCGRLRAVERFDSTAALVRAMEGDRDAGRALFADGGGACRMS
jgi:riboflavin kinase / FMN adenylyltransferase